ncbi:MAG TPA: hypothetical protein VF016_09570, partial [Nitrososphaera sp.]
ETGCKYCMVCAIWMRVGGNFCPCCRAQLRTKPRTRKGKERLRQIMRPSPFPLQHSPGNSNIMFVPEPE